MKDYKHLAPSNLVKKIDKRDGITKAVSCLGVVIGIVCWLWFINGILG